MADVSLEQVLAVVVAVQVVLSLVANIPAVRKTKCGEVCVALGAVDVASLLRIAVPMAKAVASAVKVPKGPSVE